MSKIAVRVDGNCRRVHLPLHVRGSKRGREPWEITRFPKRFRLRLPGTRFPMRVRLRLSGTRVPMRTVATDRHSRTSAPTLRSIEPTAARRDAHHGRRYSDPARHFVIEMKICWRKRFQVTMGTSMKTVASNHCGARSGPLGDATDLINVN